MTSFSPQSVSPLLRVILGAVCISFSAVFAKLSSTHPDVSAFYRTAIGGTCLLAIALYRYRESLLALLRRHFLLIGAGGVFLSLDLMAWHRSIDILGPGAATILINFQVFILALCGWLFFRERLTYRFILAVPLALFGLCLLVGITADNLFANDFTGTILGLAAALWLALYTLTVRKVQTLSRGTSGVPVVALISLVSACCMGALFIHESTSIAIPTVSDGVWLVLYGIISQALGWLLISEGLPGISSAQAGLTILIMPALSFLWDMLFFDRPAGIMELSGAFLAILAIWLGTYSPSPNSTKGEQS